MSGYLARAERGFTLVELMTSLVIGLIVSAAMISAFLTAFRSNSDNINTIRLNEELRTALSLITRELRMAGAWLRANDHVGTTNPYMANIVVGNRTGEAANSCITFTYEGDDDGVALENTDRFGFRLREGRIEYGRGTDSVALNCNVGNWNALTEPGTTEITGLSFGINTNLPGASQFFDVEVRITGITNLRGSNTAITESDVDNFNVIRRTLSKTVRVRNG